MPDLDLLSCLRHYSLWTVQGFSLESLIKPRLQILTSPSPSPPGRACLALIVPEWRLQSNQRLTTTFCTMMWHEVDGSGATS
jgi:hypothetical protein